METMTSIAELARPTRVLPDARWQASARWARRLAWVGLVVVLIEGAVGLWQGLAVGPLH
jgi:hypothetical protein